MLLLHNPEAGVTAEMLEDEHATLTSHSIPAATHNRACLGPSSPETSGPNDTFGVYRDDLSKLNASEGDHIRLLFCPRTDSENVRYVLKTVSLQSAPKYSALSYSWSYKTLPRSPREQQVPDSRSLDFYWTSEQLRVSSDLQHALECLVVSQSCRWLWVDAVCINQSNAAEKGDQVTKMKSIYEGAQQVFVWLGPERGNTRGQDWLRAEINLRRHGITGAKLTELLQQGDRAWWLRLWVIQEIVSAVEVMVVIGKCITPWEEFVDMIMSIPGDIGIYDMSPVRFEQDLASMQQEIGRLRRLRKQLRGSRGEDRLLDLLRLSSFSRASDPNDKVYGLLGLAQLEEQRLVEVNYSQTTAFAYSNAVRAIVEVTGSLNALVDRWPRGAGPSDTRDALPSWVHNFAQQVQPSPMPLSHVRHYCASARRPAAIGQTLYPQDLDIEVVRLDTVAKVANDIFRTPKEIFGTLSILERRTLPIAESVMAFANEVAWEDSEDPRSELEREDPLWRVLVADRNRTGHGRAPDVYKHIVKLLQTYGSGISRRSSVVDSIDGFVQRVAEALDNRSFFCTKLGFLGIGPNELKVGDEIVVPFGATIPFALREVPSNKCFTLVGDCFVHGVMYGELMKLLDDGKVEAEWITLV